MHQSKIFPNPGIKGAAHVAGGILALAAAGTLPAGERVSKEKKVLLGDLVAGKVRG
ncbi:hypothetical protein M1N85_03675 [Dehalococcoidia bacterium]|nr:hypothetical protein [Dehalococcoidia bacterium]MCL0102818.1 hypothetical protein [Dehalococcoidia bacterium]